jgi:hypothetical protein
MRTFEIIIAVMLASTVLMIPIVQHMAFYDERISECEHLAEEAENTPAAKYDLPSLMETFIWKINMMGLSFLFITLSSVISISGLLIVLIGGIDSEKVLKYVAFLSIFFFLCAIVLMARVILFYPIC